jgi:hypothetical protein
MIYEYGIEPALAVAWAKNQSEFEYYYEKFGLGRSKIMSEFPKFKNWRKQFKQAAAGAQDFELQRITALFNLFVERRVIREGFTYNGTISWLENAEAENDRCPFKAILSTGNPRKHKSVLSQASIKSSNLWKTEEQDYCPRMSENMAQLVLPILSNCSRLYLIDPHFGPENPRHRRPIEDFLKCMANNRFGKPLPDCIEIHTSDKAAFEFFKDTCQEKLPALIPSGYRVKLKRWIARPGGEKFHQRFILSDIGGVEVDPGLDDGKKGENFKVMLLKRKMFEKHWQDFIAAPAFDLAEAPLEIFGKA